MHNFNTKIIKISAFGLIEVLIAALILSVSLFGVAALQSRSIFTIIEAGRQETANQMINQLASFPMAASVLSSQNTNFQNNISYLADQSISPTNASIVATCYSATGCAPLSPPSNPTQATTYQAFYVATVLEWQNMLSTMLPSGQGCTCLVGSSFTAGNPQPQTSTILIAVNWKNLSGSYSTLSLSTQLPVTIIPSTVSTCLNPPLTTPFSATTATPSQICNNQV